MVVAFFVAVVLYGAVTLMFLILSSAELLDSGLSTPSGLASVLVTSLFWPLTLVAMCLLVVFQALSERASHKTYAPDLRLVHRSH